MDIEILATESLGVRGLCCCVKTARRRILIDPGVALGYTRFGLLPHPFQVAIGEKIQQKIIQRWSEATDIVISHFHGDHTPLADPNPYQLDVKKVAGRNKKARIWTKDMSSLSPLEKRRAEALFEELKQDFVVAEGKREGPIVFSHPMPHGKSDKLNTVIMTRIKEGKNIFVHASDIQLLSKKAVIQLLEWSPKIVFVSGPPLYLSRISRQQRSFAWRMACMLSEGVDTLILDHHLLRNKEGVGWLKRLSGKTGKSVICAADFMGKKRLLLEASREKLYEEMPVPPGWHENYAKGKVNTDRYRQMPKNYIK